MTSLSLPGGEKYIGTVNKQNEPSGQGKLVYPNGFSFEGSFFSKAYIGVVRDPAGQRISGYYTQKYLNNGVYEGDYVAGMRSGFGIMTFTDCSRYEGSFANDQRNGLFLVTDSEGKQHEQLYVDGSYKSQKEAGPAELRAATERRRVAESKRPAINAANVKDPMLRTGGLRQQLNEPPTSTSNLQRELDDKNMFINQLQSIVRELQSELDGVKVQMSMTRRQFAAETEVIEQQHAAEAATKIALEQAHQHALNTKDEEIRAVQQEITQLQQNIKQKTDEQVASAEFIASLQELVRTRDSEHSIATEKLQKEIDENKQTITVKNSEIEHFSTQIATNEQKYRSDIENLQLLNQELNQKVNQISAEAQQYVQEQINQFNQSTILQSGTLQCNQIHGLEQQLAEANRLIQQHELEVSKLHQLSSKQEVESMRSQMQLKDDLSRQKDEIQRLREENMQQKHALAAVKQLKNESNVCKRCSAQFVDPDDLAQHERHCTKIPCPLCEMKFKQLEQFYDHVGSHMKRDGE